ncbi:hypothetical protein AALP_AA3G148200 [Arabis alpina]|uniref:RING-type E3 ubiquitin transferase n=1 Tax=Arabis alpina TaxID=50452 RepID=A0A087H994_ARAAL|nr:hypothetical protein AALP_AA3G148200 [Arabis alpina]
MAIVAQLPCDNNDVCMKCKVTPPSEECLTCVTCATLWHVECLSCPPQSLASTAQWKCPDCSGEIDLAPVTGSDESGLVAAIHAIEADQSLTESEKAKKRQELLSGKGTDDDEKTNGDNENFKCGICFGDLSKPVSTPCGHNFCLDCFNGWVKKNKYTCGTCRTKFAQTVANNIRINLTLVSAIRLSTLPERASAAPPQIQHYIRNEDRPDEAYRTDRAKKTGDANAASGRIFVTTAPDHMGPITAEYDPERNRGVLVGDWWKGRQKCRQWGAHFPLVPGIAGQSKYGAQSVVLAAGYKDDVDNGDYILYTGSGGRDLSGNKRTCKVQSWDQTFTKSNAALQLSCRMGYPVRVIRSHKKKNAYAPEKGVRYDGIYRIEKCWRSIGEQGVFKMCRYLFVRCDNEPAPWTSDAHGDLPRPLPHIPELKNAVDLYEREESPSWDFDEAEGRWKWVKAPSASVKRVHDMHPKERKMRKKSAEADKKKLLKGLHIGPQI